MFLTCCRLSVFSFPIPQHLVQWFLHRPQHKLISLAEYSSSFRSLSLVLFWKRRCFAVVWSSNKVLHLNLDACLSHSFITQLKSFPKGLDLCSIKVFNPVKPDMWNNHNSQNSQKVYWSSLLKIWIFKKCAYLIHQAFVVRLFQIMRLKVKIWT